MASEKDKTRFSFLNIWKWLKSTDKIYGSLKKCLKGCFDIVNPQITDELRHRFNVMAMFLQLRQKEGRYHIWTNFGTRVEIVSYIIFHFFELRKSIGAIMKIMELNFYT